MPEDRCSAERDRGSPCRPTEEFIRPLGLRQPALAAELGVSLNRVNEIVLGKRSITADTAIRLARRFKMSPQFWMRLQADWDLAQALARDANDAA